jgi:hypothetical protein
MPAWLIVGTDKEEDGLAHPAGKRPRKQPLFGGAPQKMETGSDFAIGLISSPRWKHDTEQQRRPSNDRVPGIALQWIESAAGSEIGLSRRQPPNAGVELNCFAVGNNEKRSETGTQE